MPRRRPTSHFLTAAAVLALGAGLAACSDDEPEPSSTARTPAAAGKVAKCDVEVTVTGAAEAEWTGKGEVSLRGEGDTGDGPEATYLSDDRKNQLTVLSAGPGFEATATLGIGDAVFVGNPADQGLEVAEDGGAASADLDLTDVDGNVARLVADFTCA
jgi:hypothetical protein